MGRRPLRRPGDVDGAVAAYHVLSRRGDIDDERLAGIVQATKEHQIGPPSFMAMIAGFGLKDSMDLISASAPVDEVRVSGGGAVSDLWLQILADVLGTPLHRLGTTEGAAHGAAMLAALREFHQPVKQEDDITVTVIKINE